MPNLYVTEQGAVIEKEYERILVTKEDEVLLKVPAVRLEGVVIVGNAGMTTPAFTFFLDRGIPVVFLKSNGQFRGRLAAGSPKNVFLRQAQYARKTPSFV